jgi:sugar porter (SP) family MFS transporter
VSPTYIAEISPARLRGRLVAMTQFNIVLGILLAFLSNYLIGLFDFGPLEWRWMFGVEAVPAAVFFALLTLVPRSPRWLMANGLRDEARDVLSQVGADTDDIDAELSVIEASLHQQQTARREPFFQRKYSRPILLAVAIAMFNQLSGINAILYYAPRIFAMAGAAEGSALLQSVIVGATNLVFTVLALAVIDHFGRRNLMIVGSIGYILSLAAVAGAFHAYSDQFAAVEQTSAVLQQANGTAGTTPATLAAAEAAVNTATADAAFGGTIVLIGLMVFIASHAFGQGAVIWVFISEIFPNRVRARGQSLGSLTHWAVNAAISWTFPMIAAAAGGNVFAFYAVMMVLQLLWVLMLMPETKGVTLEEIERELGIR